MLTVDKSLRLVILPNARLFHVTASHLRKSKKELLKEQLSEGPELGDFIAGVVPRDSTWSSYEGQLKLEKGEKGRLLSYLEVKLT